ncbi:MAG: BlaI/MecI/CopY family transcriptional regulator [Planctomycetaceae bacterium]|nr:BlaI/MecI/CopY family transcriptional regulator [Planctomycetaceae bacterium]
MSEQIPSERELQILKILWKSGPLSVRDVCDELNRLENSELAYTSVLTLLQIMERKGFADHEQAGRSYRYFAKVEKPRIVGGLTEKFLSHVFDGAMDEMLASLIGSQKVSEEEIKKLEKMLQELGHRASGIGHRE